MASTVEVLILQHPMEVSNAKGSARLLHLCLPGSRMEVGEQFDEAALQDLLEAGGRQPVLLYPDTPGDRSHGIAPPPQFNAVLAPAQVRLVVLDATWRKSRKMLYLNPALQALPRLPLRDTPPSHYLIRKAHAPDQLDAGSKLLRAGAAGGHGARLPVRHRGLRRLRRAAASAGCARQRG